MRKKKMKRSNYANEMKRKGNTRGTPIIIVNSMNKSKTRRSNKIKRRRMIIRYIQRIILGKEG